MVGRFRNRGTQWLFLDEAGLLSFDGLNALIALYDAARTLQYPLSLVLLGNDDLALKVKRRSQVDNRVKEWIYVNPLTYDQLHSTLPQLAPVLQSSTTDELTRLSQFLHDTYHGNLRATQACLERLFACWIPPQPLNQVLLLAAHEQSARAQQRALDDARGLVR